MFFRRPPDKVVGPITRPYILRWYVIPRNKRMNVYLHKLMRDDDDRAPHDHPWAFLSIVLQGSYVERLASLITGHGFTVVTPEKLLHRKRFSFALRRTRDRHRVTLPKDELGRAIPCLTLVITGPVVQEWGFFCKSGKVHNKVFGKTGCD